MVTEAEEMLKVATEEEATPKVVIEAEEMLKVAAEANLEDTITSKEMAQSIPFIINQEVHLVSKTNLKMIQISILAESQMSSKVLLLQLQLLLEINLPKNQPEATLAVHRQEQEGVHK